MTLLTQIKEAAIVENLKKRYMDDQIFVSEPAYCTEVFIDMYCDRFSKRERHDNEQQDHLTSFVKKEMAV